MSSLSTLRTKSLQKWLSQPLNILFVLILLGGIFFRFYGTPDRFGFDKDPTRDVLVTLYGRDHLAFPLIGPSSGIASFTFGPWYYYELIIFSMLIPSPFAPFYFIPLLSVTLIILMYLIGRELKDKYLGLILASFAAFSPSFVGPASGLSNPNLVAPHVALGILLFVLFMKKKGNTWLALIWGLMIGIGINHHYQMIPILILPFIYFTLHIKKLWRWVILFLIGLILSFLPLIYFNISYHWYTLEGISKFVQSGGSNNYIPNSWHIYLLYFWPKFFAYIFSVPVSFSLFIGIVLGVTYLYLLIKKKLSSTILILGVAFLIIFIILRYYNAERTYYYFLFLEPLLFIIVGFALRAIGFAKMGIIIMGAILAIFILLSIPENFERTRQDSNNRNAIALAKLITDKSGSQNISIYACQQQPVDVAQGVAFLLLSEKKLSDSGLKIGFNSNSDNCHPLDSSITQIEQNLYNLDHLSDRILNKYGWYKINPETVYKNTVLWWTPEYEKI